MSAPPLKLLPLLDAGCYTGCMKQHQRDDGRTANLRPVRMRVAGMAIGPAGYVLLIVGILAQWPWLVLTGALLSLVSAVLFIAASAARVANRA